VVAAVGAGLLLVSLFLDWYGFRDGGPNEAGISAWTAFEVWDLVLAAIAILALMAAAERFGWVMPIRGRGLTGLGLAALVIVASQLINHPPLGQAGSLEVGAWLALGSAILIGAGGVPALARISVEVVVDRDANGAAPGTRDVEREAREEAAAEEPKVERELYPDAARGDGPIGADDPEPFRAGDGSEGSEEETRRIE
jgi:hypothetical protein